MKRSFVTAGLFALLLGALIAGAHAAPPPPPPPPVPLAEWVWDEGMPKLEPIAKQVPTDPQTYRMVAKGRIIFESKQSVVVGKDSDFLVQRAPLVNPTSFELPGLPFPVTVGAQGKLSVAGKADRWYYPVEGIFTINGQPNGQHKSFLGSDTHRVTAELTYKLLPTDQPVRAQMEPVGYAKLP
ncbi:MAG: hypothetical protein K2X82_05070 [Gemmataceae bacterium]|nr:hypothetical protein [Gemmataceae bacterium]